MTYTLEDFNEFLARTGFTIEEVCEHTGYSRPGFNKFLYSGRRFNPRIMKSLEMMEKNKELEEENLALKITKSILQKEIEMMERRHKREIEEIKKGGKL